MKINQTPAVIKSQPTFENKYVEKVMKVIPDTRTGKNITYLDAIATQSYIKSIPFRLKTTMAEINELKKLEGSEFILKSYLFLCKKLGFSENVRPGFNIVEDIANEGKMFYSPILNVIFCKAKEIEQFPKDEVFAFIRHELQHFIQNTSALRHETYGEKAVEVMVQSYKINESNSFIAVIKNYTDEQLDVIFKESPETVFILKNFRKLYEKGQTQAIDELLEAHSQQYRSDVLKVQEHLKRELGVISKNSPLSEKIQQDFVALHSSNYYNADASIDYKKYFSSEFEVEAGLAQSAANFAFKNSSECEMKLIKDMMLKSLVDENGALQKILAKIE